MKPIGTDLSGVTNYSTELVFTDAFKQDREWISFDADYSGGWDSGIDVPLLPNGFPALFIIIGDEVQKVVVR